MNDEHMSLGAYIRKLRKQKGLSLRELARQLNLSAPFVSDVELDRRRPKPDSWEKWAETLGADLKEFQVVATLRRCPDCPFKKEVTA
jgi:transcriptional regulator with XRE-family HTH domain